MQMESKELTPREMPIESPQTTIKTVDVRANGRMGKYWLSSWRISY